MSAIKDRAGFAMIADVVGSSETKDFVRGRDRRLERLSARHLDQGWLRSAYTVTAWDEFQTYGWEPGVVARVVLDLRQTFAPWALRIGIGLGGIRGWRSRRPINEAVTGSAFERAREAIEALDAAGSKVPRLTRFRTGDATRDSLLDLVYGLHDTLVQGVSERQWETIGHAMSGATQEEIATKLGVDASTVSRNLRRGYYWQMQETLDRIPVLLASD